MNKIVASVAALTLLTGPAFASSVMSGTVHSFDRNARVIVLDDGSSASVSIQVGIPADLAAGSHAKIEFSNKDGAVTRVFTQELFTH